MSPNAILPLPVKTTELFKSNKIPLVIIALKVIVAFDVRRPGDAVAAFVFGRVGVVGFIGEVWGDVAFL